MASLICKSAVRKRILELCRKHRGHKFDRVASITYAALEYKVDMILKALVLRHPSKGQTFKAEHVDFVVLADRLKQKGR